MNIVDLKIFQYSLPLNKPLKVKGEELTERQGLALILLDSDGKFGFGEISPLPGFSRETVAGALEQLLQHKGDIFAEDPPSGLELLDGKFDEWLGKYQLYPSVRFGLEMAVLNLIAAQRNILLRELISPDSHEDVPICALLTGTKHEVVTQSLELIEQGFKTFKLKVGRGKLEEDIEKVVELNKAFNGKAILRVDANQAWTLNDALTFSHEAGLASVEYIEEPFSDLGQIEAFTMKTTIPVALDESLTVLPFEKVRSMVGVEILVLKPTILGGFEITKQIMDGASANGITVIVSSAYETGLGIEALAHLACCARVEYPAGLDTLKVFKTDLPKKSIQFDHGRIKLLDRRTNYELNKELLTEVTYE